MPVNRHMIGIVENVHATYGFLRDVSTWERYFFHAHDCDAGDLPELHARVEFSVIPDPPRLPRAVDVIVIAPPTATLHRRCFCGQKFEIDAGAQAWFAARDFLLPSRCPECRASQRKDYGPMKTSSRATGIVGLLIVVLLAGQVVARAELRATNAFITGTITASSGTIGGWTIGSTSLTGGNVTLNSSGGLAIVAPSSRFDDARAYRFGTGVGLYATSANAFVRGTTVGFQATGSRNLSLGAGGLLDEGGNINMNIGGDITFPGVNATGGTRYVCISASGQLSAATSC